MPQAKCSLNFEPPRRRVWNCSWWVSLPEHLDPASRCLQQQVYNHPTLLQRQWPSCRSKFLEPGRQELLFVPIKFPHYKWPPHTITDRTISRGRHVNVRLWGIHSLKERLSVPHFSNPAQDMSISVIAFNEKVEAGPDIKGLYVSLYTCINPPFILYLAPNVQHPPLTVYLAHLKPSWFLPQARLQLRPWTYLHDIPYLITKAFDTFDLLDNHWTEATALMCWDHFMRPPTPNVTRAPTRHDWGTFAGSLRDFCPSTKLSWQAGTATQYPLYWNLSLHSSIRSELNSTIWERSSLPTLFQSFTLGHPTLHRISNHLPACRMAASQLPVPTLKLYSRLPIAKICLPLLSSHQ